MGSGIALVANQVAGLNVKVCDAQEKSLAYAQKTYEGTLDGQVKKGKITKEVRDQVLSRFSYTTKLDDLHEADFVVEVLLIKLIHFLDFPFKFFTF